MKRLLSLFVFLILLCSPQVWAQVYSKCSQDDSNYDKCMEEQRRLAEIRSRKVERLPTLGGKVERERGGEELSEIVQNQQTTLNDKTKKKNAIQRYFNPDSFNGVVRNVYQNVSCVEYKESFARNEDGDWEPVTYLARDFNSCRRAGRILQTFEGTVVADEVNFKRVIQSKDAEIKTTTQIMQQRGEDPSVYLQESNIELNRKKVSFHNRRMVSYTSAATTLLGFRGLGGWNTTKGQCDNKESCEEFDDANSEMKGVVNSKILEYGQKALAERGMKKEAETAVAVAQERLNNLLAGAGQRNNEDFCRNNPHLASCQRPSGANTDTRFNPTSGSGLLPGRSLPNNVVGSSSEDFGDGDTDIADSFQDTEESVGADFAGIGDAKFAESSSGGASGGGAGLGGGGGGAGLGGGSPDKAKGAKKKGISARSLKNLYKKKRKARAKRSIASSSKRAKDFLSNLLKKKDQNARKGGIIFKDRKELNRALAHDGVRSRRGLNLFTRISRAHQSLLLNPQKELIVYNSP